MDRVFFSRYDYSILVPMEARMGKLPGNTMRTLGLLFLAISLTLPAHTVGKVIKVVTLHGYAPYCFTQPPALTIDNEVVAPGEDSQHLHGYSWDIVRESLHSQDLTILLTVVPWSRALTLLQEGKADMLFPAGTSSRRRSLYAYSKSTVTTARMLIYVRKDSKLQWNGLNALNNVTIATLRGATYGDQWDALDGFQVKKYPVNSIPIGLKMLRAGRVDGFAGYEANWDHFIHLLGWEGEFKKLPVFRISDEHCVAMHGNDDSRVFLELFDKGMREIKRTGKLKSIHNRWLGTKEPSPIDKAQYQEH